MFLPLGCSLFNVQPKALNVGNYAPLQGAHLGFFLSFFGIDMFCILAPLRAKDLNTLSLPCPSNTLCSHMSVPDIFGLESYL